MLLHLCTQRIIPTVIKVIAIECIREGWHDPHCQDFSRSGNELLTWKGQCWGELVISWCNEQLILHTGLCILHCDIDVSIFMNLGSPFSPMRACVSPDQGRFQAFTLRVIGHLYQDRFWSLLKGYHSQELHGDKEGNAFLKRCYCNRIDWLQLSYLLTYFLQILGVQNFSSATKAVQ